MASRDGDRVVALSLQLSQAHSELRRQIREIRSSLGNSRLGDDVLLTHCLAFCTALASHHHGEDDGMFAQPLRERPDLAAIMESHFGYEERAISRALDDVVADPGWPGMVFRFARK